MSNLDNQASSKTNPIQIIIGLILFGVAAILGFYFIRYIFLVFRSLQKEVAVAIVAASATVLVSVFSVLISKSWERKRDIELEHRNKKIPIYEDFISFWFNLLFADKVGKKALTEKDMIEFLNDFTQKIMLWGSDKVVAEYSRFRRICINLDPKEPNPESLFELEKLLLAMRKDTGHKNKNFKEGDILALFINDVDKYL